MLARFRRLARPLAALTVSAALLAACSHEEKPRPAPVKQSADRLPGLSPAPRDAVTSAPVE